MKKTLGLPPLGTLSKDQIKQFAHFSKSETHEEERKKTRSIPEQRVLLNYYRSLEIITNKRFYVDPVELYNRVLDKVESVEKNTGKTIIPNKELVKIILELESTTQKPISKSEKKPTSAELTEAILEAKETMKDTELELNKISRDLKERGMIEDTTKTLDETVAAANEAAESFRQTVDEMKESTLSFQETIKRTPSRKKKQAC
jgi:methyl-accepting chemotaxis protein